MTLLDMIKRSETDPSIPYVISPRKTFLDTRRPKLRWNKVKGANSYTVKIVTDSKIIWEQTVKETEFNSRDDLPLEPGVDYSLIVESDNGSSSKMDSDKSSISFQLLDEDKIKSLANEEKKITELGLTDDEETLELADLHFSESGLIAKAIEILEQRIAAASQTSEIYVTLGNLYRFVGLYSLAEERYRKALELIKPGIELEEQIIAQAGLAIICTLLGNETEANRLKQDREEALKILKIKQTSGAILEESRISVVRRTKCDCPDDPHEKKLSGGLCTPDCVPDLTRQNIGKNCKN